MEELVFTPFPKIPRLLREITITEKIDGTNASVFVPEDDGPLRAASRTRWIAPGKTTDNAGFAAWVQTHAEELRAILGPGHHFGEWFGQKIQRGYGLTERRFALFNTRRFLRYLASDGPPVAAEDVITFPSTACDGQLMVVPALYHGLFDQAEVENALNLLRQYGSVVVPGFMRPEGVVIYHRAADQCFKVTLEHDEAPKGIYATR